MRTVYIVIVIIGISFAMTSCTPPSEDEKTVEKIIEAANKGHVDEQFYLGTRYHMGTGISQDTTQAAHWYQQAADQGHAEAQFLLGGMYAQGDGVPQDNKKALHWWSNAAAQGNAQAQANLGMRYYEGTGVVQDYKQATQWFEQAADQGHADAQFMLGLVNVLGFISSSICTINYNFHSF